MKKGLLICQDIGEIPSWGPHTFRRPCYVCCLAQDRPFTQVYPQWVWKTFEVIASYIKFEKSPYKEYQDMITYTPLGLDVNQNLRILVSNVLGSIKSM